VLITKSVTKNINSCEAQYVEDRETDDEQVFILFYTMDDDACDFDMILPQTLFTQFRQK